MQHIIIIIKKKKEQWGYHWWAKTRKSNTQRENKEQWGYHWWAKTGKSNIQRENKSQYYRGSKRLSKEVHGKGFLDSEDGSSNKGSFHGAGRQEIKQWDQHWSLKI